MGYNAAGDWVPDEDLTNVSGANTDATTTIDDQIAATQKDIAASKERIRVANQSLQNIDPKYEMNQPYIKKLNTQILSEQTALDLLESKLSSLQTQKENATAKKPAAATSSKKTVPEDSATPPISATQTPTSDKTKRTYNPLGKFSSYTYRLSLYMMTAEAMNTHNDTGIWNKKDLFLVAQSAGTGEDDTRAPGFNFDYYIDNLDVTHLIAAKTAGFSGNSVEISFDVYEPYGMTFPTKLLGAAKALEQRTTFANPFMDQIHMGTALTQYYLLVVRFYGYDSKGNLVSTPLSAKATGDKTDDPGLFERAFPIVINDMKTKLDNRMVKYAITAVPITQRVSQSQYTGTIQEALTISGDTVSDILSDSQTSLVSLLNKKEEDLVKAKKKEVANVYKIEFEDISPIANARLVDKNTYVPSQTPMMGVPSAVNVRVANSGKAATVSKQKRSIQIPASSRIPQAIEQVVSQSTYITDCLAVINKEETQPVTETDTDVSENAAPKEFSWFIVIPQIKKIGVDKELKTSAYEITYRVIKYNMPFIRSPYFTNKSKYPGPHKIYNYWYTGQNESVLSFDITYNSLYYGVASAYSTGKIKNNDTTPMAVTSSTGGDTQGKAPGTSEGTSSFKSWLYSPDDQITANLKIIGDPDYLMTAEYGTFNEMLSKDVGDEAPINPIGSQVFIEVGLNSVEDYGANGLLKPEANIKMWPQSPELEKITNGRMVFGVTAVKSRFVRGQFTQELQEMYLPTNIDGGATASDVAAGREATTPTAGAGRGKTGGPTAEQLKQVKQTPEDENNFVSNNEGKANSEVDAERPFIGYRSARRRTNKQNTTGG